MEGILLIIGAGSIGRRHALNARELGLRTIVCDVDVARAEKLSSDAGSEKFYEDYKKACDENTDIVASVVASPSQFHIENAKFLVERGVHVFIEKPLATETKGIDDLVKSIELKKVVVMMGQSYRFHEGYLYLKKILEEGIIGKVYHVTFMSGQYLPDWHPKMDYRTEYAAQKKLGGGALFTSMSHLFDSIAYFFGDINEIIGWKSRLSDLEMDVEDSVFCLTKTEQDIVVMCQTDFLQRTSKHRMVLVGENGNIEADFVKHEISVEILGDKPSTRQYTFDANKRYIDELKHFVYLIAQGTTKHSLDIYAGKRVVELLNSKAIQPITEV